MRGYVVLLWAPKRFLHFFPGPRGLLLFWHWRKFVSWLSFLSGYGSFFNQPQLSYLYMIREKTCKVDKPYSVTYLNWTPIFKWYAVCCDPNNTYQNDMCVKEIWLLAQHNYPRFNRQYDYFLKGGGGGYQGCINCTRVLYTTRSGFSWKKKKNNHLRPTLPYKQLNNVKVSNWREEIIVYKRTSHSSNIQTLKQYATKIIFGAY